MDWCRAGVLVLAAGFIFASPAHAAPRGDDLIKKAKAAYDDYEFDKAAAYYQDAIRIGVRDAKKREQALLYYAFSLFGLERKPEAALQLRELFKLNPLYSLDRKGQHPALLKFYDEERALADASKPATPQVVVTQPKPQEPPLPPPRLPDQPQTITVAPETPRAAEVTQKAAPRYESAHPVLKVLPLGIGQFANGDPLGGSLFLVSELALIGANVAFAVLDQNARAQFEVAPSQQLQNDITLFYAMRTASGVAAILVGAFGILDAFLWSPDRGEARHKKRYSFMAAPIPSGGALAASLRF